MKVASKIFELELKYPFGISRSTHRKLKTLIVKLEHDGATGYGETVENKYYGYNVHQMQNKLKEIKPIIENERFETPEKLWGILVEALYEQRFLLSAIDIAANDLYGKLLDKPLYKVWNFDLDNIPITNYTIGIDSIDVMKEKIQKNPWAMYKIKLGTKDDLSIIRELRGITDSTFRVDANAAWTKEETIKNSHVLKSNDVEFIEQPIAPDSWGEMEEVFAQSALPLIADESCRIEEDVEKCVGRFHGINVKLGKAGGVTPALRMLKNAKSLGLKTMVGCMTESSIGIAPIGHLLPILDYVDMDGALLLKNDLAQSHQIDKGVITLSGLSGTGAKLLDENAF